MSQKSGFSGSILCNSIQSTFKRRGFGIPVDIPIALTDSFFKDSVKKAQWKAFVKKKKIKEGDVDFTDIANTLKAFLIPPLSALQQEKTFDMTWNPYGPWQKS
jgi:hypothetical protein